MKNPVAARILAVLAGLFALAEVWVGGKLLLLGGSAYYVIAGIVTALGAVLLWRGQGQARTVFHVLLAGTAAWALWETGGEFWGMLSRLGLVAGLWLLAMLVTRRHGQGAGMPSAKSAAAVITGLLGLGLAGALLVGPRLEGAEDAAETATAEPQWQAYARTLDAQRHSPLTQINAGNADKLEVAWTYRTGDLPQSHDEGREWTFEATPIKVDDKLILCTTHNWIIALDADSGERIWQFDPQVDDKATFIKACRGVGFYQAPSGEEGGECPQRIIAATLDGRLFALDARTGKLCPSFGDKGFISVYQGMDNPEPGFAFVTSAPLIVGRVAIVGGWVADSFATQEPSGAVRAYDVETGDLVWAWDNGKAQRAPFPADLKFAKGTPNVWAPMSADPELGLVYLPTGNATPDYWGGHRTPELEKFASSIVAVDAATGELRWSFQTVHHDIWDYDVPAAPVLFDFKGDGGIVPALAQVTKQGEVFVLDRRTGKPLIPVEERAVPQDGVAKGDWLAPTQPFSTAPNIRGDQLSEASMWGITPLDQAACRIAFRTYRYEGIYTPQSVQGTIDYPAPYGATDWGGATYDSERGLLIVNSSQAPFVGKLVPRKQVDAIVKPAMEKGIDPATVGYGPQFGTPFGYTGFPMLSPLQIPCIAPPWGYLTAIDLNANKVAWKVPLGSARDTGPLGMKVGLPLELGVFSMGGATSTRGGVTFIGATLDHYLRAFETATGKLLWKGRLPAGGQATPMTYTGTNGRQYVVISAGGHGALQTRYGDYVVAFALPEGGD